MTDMQALLKLTYGLYVVGVKNGDGFGGCVVDAVMQTTVSPCTLVLCSSKTSLTCQRIGENKEFTLSVLPVDADPAVIARFGFQSARTADKWADTPHDLMGGLPVLKEAAARLRCRVTESKELSTHILYFCDVEEAEDGPSKALSYTDYRDNWKDKMTAVSLNKEEKEMEEEKEKEYVYVCTICNYEYDGEIPFEELPDDYVCPICGVGKDEFKKVENK